MTRLLHYVFIRDWPLKLFSFALAVLTWLVVSLPARMKDKDVPSHADLVEKSYSDLPITLVSANGDVHEFKVKPSEVDTLWAQGEPARLDRTGRQHFRVLADLTSIAPTNGHKIRLTVIPPPGISVQRIEPAEVELIPPPR